MLPPPVDMCFAPAAFLREDHFPGAPCVPGSCLLEAVCRAAEQACGRPVLEVTQARFRRFVQPGRPCRLCWRQAAPPDGASGTDAGAWRLGWLVREGPEPDAARLAEGELRLGPAGPADREGRHAPAI